MTTNTIPQVLTKEQQAAGLYLTEDEDILYLMWQGEEKPLAEFSATGVTVAALRKEADQHMEAARNGVSFHEDGRK